ncbi:hypothetical protein BDM02DRAFT_3129302 [Thelephora ganbajun]|uniref:Uncharacterized protein n=1 Tax=Thelephora ganbajun TaxID=370292 RepID=A0ACB6ZEX1_THEGA|nr:hypothetical protein BDM02DRAFT_3129302 [Thelephora ganbajun]
MAIHPRNEDVPSDSTHKYHGSFWTLRDFRGRAPHPRDYGYIGIPLDHPNANLGTRLRPHFSLASPSEAQSAVDLAVARILSRCSRTMIPTLLILSVHALADHRVTNPIHRTVELFPDRRRFPFQYNPQDIYISLLESNSSSVSRTQRQWQIPKLLLALFMRSSESTPGTAQPPLKPNTSHLSSSSPVYRYAMVPPCSGWFLNPAGPRSKVDGDARVTGSVTNPPQPDSLRGVISNSFLLVPSLGPPPSDSSLAVAALLQANW